MAVWQLSREIAGKSPATQTTCCAASLDGLALLLAACAGRKPRRNASASRHRRPRTCGTGAKPQAQRYDTSGGEPDGQRVHRRADRAGAAARTALALRQQVATVLGKHSTVLPDAAGYVERGVSSWYGAKFHGYMTSSLEPYDMYQFSAAHKSLPLPSWARVTNLENGKSVVVRINDRGPFHDNRLIDLSYAAAVRIGIWPKGAGWSRCGRSTRPGRMRRRQRPQPRNGVRPAAHLQRLRQRTNAERVERDLRAQRLQRVHIAVGVDGRGSIACASARWPTSPPPTR